MSFEPKTGPLIVTGFDLLSACVHESAGKWATASSALACSSSSSSHLFSHKIQIFLFAAELFFLHFTIYYHQRKFYQLTVDINNPFVPRGLNAASFRFLSIINNTDDPQLVWSYNHRYQSSLSSSSLAPSASLSQGPDSIAGDGNVTGNRK